MSVFISSAIGLVLTHSSNGQVYTPDVGSVEKAFELLDVENMPVDSD